MKYTYATLLLHETGAEINEHNLTSVLEAADANEITNSRVKALVAALEDVDIGDYAAAATPATIETDASTEQSDEPEPDTPSETEPTQSEELQSGLVFGEDDTEATEEESATQPDDDDQEEAPENDPEPSNDPPVEDTPEQADETTENNEPED